MASEPRWILDELFVTVRSAIHRTHFPETVWPRVIKYFKILAVDWCVGNVFGEISVLVNRVSYCAGPEGVMHTACASACFACFARLDQWSFLAIFCMFCQPSAFICRSWRCSLATGVVSAPFVLRRAAFWWNEYPVALFWKVLCTLSLSFVLVAKSGTRSVAISAASLPTLPVSCWWCLMLIAQMPVGNAEFCVKVRSPGSRTNYRKDE